MTPSWGKYFMEECLSTFDIPKESAAGVSGKAHSAYSDAFALLSPQSREEQERSDCSPGAEDRKKVLIFLEEAHECFQDGENRFTLSFGLRKSWWSVWDTQELSLAPSRKNCHHHWMSECVRGIPQLPWDGVTEGSLSGERNFGSPGGRSEPRLGSPTMEGKRARGRIKGTSAGVFWKELFTAAWVLENELEWHVQQKEDKEFASCT